MELREAEVKELDADAKKSERANSSAADLRAGTHLAMRGAPSRAIQELAGHRELGMTQRYMHLSPAVLDSAIRLLDQPWAVQSF